MWTSSLTRLQASPSTRPRPLCCHSTRLRERLSSIPPVIACHQHWRWLQLLRSCFPEGQFSCPGVVVVCNWAAAAKSNTRSVCQLSALPPSAKPKNSPPNPPIQFNSMHCPLYFFPPQEPKNTIETEPHRRHCWGPMQMHTEQEQLRLLSCNCHRLKSPHARAGQLHLAVLEP